MSYSYILALEHLVSHYQETGSPNLFLRDFDGLVRLEHFKELDLDPEEDSVEDVVFDWCQKLEADNAVDIYVEYLCAKDGTRMWRGKLKDHPRGNFVECEKCDEYLLPQDRDALWWVELIPSFLARIPKPEKESLPGMNEPGRELPSVLWEQKLGPVTLKLLLRDSKPWMVSLKVQTKSRWAALGLFEAQHGWSVAASLSKGPPKDQ